MAVTQTLEMVPLVCKVYVKEQVNGREDVEDVEMKSDMVR